MKTSNGLFENLKSGFAAVVSLSKANWEKVLSIDSNDPRAKEALKIIK